jgi:hypothetical protein
VIENYLVTEEGIVKQIKYNKICYDLDYIKTFVDLDRIHKGKHMSYIRFGLISGIISFSHTCNKKILDVGYGSGSFLSVCKDAGFNIFGNDIVMNSNSDIPFVSDIFHDRYDIVTFFDSLEHFDDIHFINRLKTRYIVITVPWCHYFSDEWFYKWKHRKPNEHLWHFNDKALVKFMGKYGYECVNLSNTEDVIRRPVDKNPNILTGIFKNTKL